MDSQRANRGRSMALLVLSIAALLMILNGYFQAPQADEASPARIFQIFIEILIPMIVLFLATTDWTKPFKRLWLLAFIAVVFGLAFTALYYLRNYFHTAPRH